jgi:hypothetical protein
MQGYLTTSDGIIRLAEIEFEQTSPGMPQLVIWNGRGFKNESGFGSGPVSFVEMIQDPKPTSITPLPA